MAVGMPLGTRRMMKRCRRPVLMEKVSHHGKTWERWRRVGGSRVPRSRGHSASSLQGRAFYPLIHGIPKTPAIAEAISLLKPRPVGLIVMVACRTKFEAYKVTRRPEFAGMKCGSVRGDRIKNDPDTIARLNGYQRYVPDDGQAWVQKPRVKLRLTSNESDGEVEMIRREMLQVGEVNEDGDVTVSLRMGVRITADKAIEAKDLIMSHVYREAIQKLGKLKRMARYATASVNGHPPHPEAASLVMELEAWEKDLIAQCCEPIPTEAAGEVEGD